MARVTQEQLTAALAQQFAAAVEAGLGTTVTAVPGATAPGPAWTSRVTVGGGLTGQLELSVTATGARGIAAKLLGTDEEPDPSVVSDMLREMWTQAIGVVSAMPACAGVTLAAAAPQSTEQDAGRGWMLSAGAEALAQIVVAGTLSAGLGASSTPPAPSVGAAGQSVAADANLAVLMDIDLPLVVRFARTDMTLKALTELGPGSLVDTGRSPEDPVDVPVGGQVIAQGEVVVVGGNYGVRITSVLGPAARLSALEEPTW